MNEDLKGKNCLAEVLHEALLSLNTGFGVIFAVVAFWRGGQAIRMSASYLLFPGTLFLLNHGEALNRLLHLSRGSDIGFEIIACASILVIASAVFLVLRLVARTAWKRAVLYPLGGLAAIALLPSLYEHFLQSSWGPGRYSYWQSPEWPFFTLEVLLVCAFFFLTRKWRHPVWIDALVLLLHYSLWTAMWWWMFVYRPLWSTRLFYFVFPCSGFAWLYYSRTEGEKGSAEEKRGQKRGQEPFFLRD